MKTWTKTTTAASKAKVKVCVRLSPDAWQMMRHYSKKRGITQTALIETALVKECEPARLGK